MTHETQQERGARMLKESGYSSGGEVAKVKRVVKKALREHENHEHGGEHTKLKLKRGGEVTGAASYSRPDRRAKGGKIGAVNIMIGKHGGEDQMQAQQAAQAGLRKGMQMGAALGARQAARGMAGPPRPPMGGPPPGAMPPGGPGIPGAGIMADGGMVKVRAHQRRKAGGPI